MAIYDNTSTTPVVLDALTGADKPGPPRLAPEFANEHVGIGTLDDQGRDTRDRSLRSSSSPGVREGAGALRGIDVFALDGIVTMWDR